MKNCLIKAILRNMRKSSSTTQDYLPMHALSRGCVCHNINNRTHDEFYLLLVLLLTKGMISAAQCSAVHCALVALLVEHRAVTREVVSSTPAGPTRKRTHTLVEKSRACSSRCCGLCSVVYHGWEGKCSEILATPSYSKIRG